MEEYGVIVIGGGPAGVTAALRARELGASAALVERRRMGGTCTNDGCVPTRVLAKAARLIRDAEQFSEYGLNISPPELDFERLMQRTQHVVYTIHEKKQLIGHLQDAGVEVLAEVGEARFVDAHTIALPDGRQLAGEKIILCAGGRARRLDFPGEELALTHSDVWSLKSLPRSLVVVGGAATGCQLASIFVAFGAEVTLLEISPRILRTEDEAVVQVLQSEFLRHGIRIIAPFEGVKSIEDRGKTKALTIARDGNLETLEAEVILVSTGWLGNLASLNLPAANVETVGPYVKVDDYLRTTTPHIFAAGDITGRMMLVQSAGIEAQAAVENALLGVGALQKHRVVPHGGFTDPEYGSVGMTEEQARLQGEVAVAVVPYSDLDRAVIDGHPVGLCKLIISQETHRLVGAHVVGEQALEIVEIAAAAMEADMWIEQLAELELAYPTFTGIIGLAARQIVSDMGVRPLAPEWHVLGKRFSAEWESRNS